jgi:hypothetical protein
MDYDIQRKEKDMKMKTIRVMMMAVLLVLMGTMQAAAVEYKNSYQRQGIMNSHSQPVSPTRTAMMPNAAFRSTSTMSFTTGTEAENTLNANGTVNAGAYGIGKNNVSGGPRRDPKSDSGINTPGDGEDDDDDENGSPIGDAVLPLLLLALAYLSTRVLLKSRAVKG